MPIDIQSLMAALQARGGAGPRLQPRPGGVAEGGRTLPMDAISRRIEQMGGQLPDMPDPRGPVGILSRGANVYPGGGPAQQGGGSQFGRPVEGPPGLGGEGPPGLGGAMPPGMGGTPPGLEGLLPPRNAILRRIQAQRGNNGLFA